MKLLALLVVAALACVAPTAQATTAPKLRLVSPQPLVVRGEGFLPRERVAVTAITMIGPRRVVARASVRGRFVATLGLVSQPCGDAVAVRALGARGSAAWVDVPSRPCVPPPVD